MRMVSLWRSSSLLAVVLGAATPRGEHQTAIFILKADFTIAKSLLDRLEERLDRFPIMQELCRKLSLRELMISGTQPIGECEHHWAQLCLFQSFGRDLGRQPLAPAVTLLSVGFRGHLGDLHRIGDACVGRSPLRVLVNTERRVADVADYPGLLCCERLRHHSGRFDSFRHHGVPLLARRHDLHNSLQADLGEAVGTPDSSLASVA